MAFSLFVEMLNLKMRSRKPAPHALPSRRLQRAINRIEGAAESIKLRRFRNDGSSEFCRSMTLWR